MSTTADGHLYEFTIVRGERARESAVRRVWVMRRRRHTLANEAQVNFQHTLIYWLSFTKCLPTPATRKTFECVCVQEPAEGTSQMIIIIECEIECVQILKSENLWGRLDLAGSEKTLNRKPRPYVSLPAQPQITNFTLPETSANTNAPIDG